SKAAVSPPWTRTMAAASCGSGLSGAGFGAGTGSRRPPVTAGGQGTGGLRASAESGVSLPQEGGWIGSSSPVYSQAGHRVGRVPLMVLLTVLAHGRLVAQERTVTLEEAIRLAERTQPTVVQAEGQVRTAAAQRRNAWGNFLPSLTASSSASEFFSEGASRVDP